MLSEFDVRTLRVASASLEEIVEHPEADAPLLIRPTYAWSSNDLDRLHRDYLQIPAADKPDEFLEFRNREIAVRFMRLFVNEQRVVLKAIRNALRIMKVHELRMDVLWGKHRKEISVAEEWTAGDVPKLIFKPC